MLALCISYNLKQGFGSEKHAFDFDLIGSPGFVYINATFGISSIDGKTNQFYVILTQAKNSISIKIDKNYYSIPTIFYVYFQNSECDDWKLAKNDEYEFSGKISTSSPVNCAAFPVYSYYKKNLTFVTKLNEKSDALLIYSLYGPLLRTINASTTIKIKDLNMFMIQLSTTSISGSSVYVNVASSDDASSDDKLNGVQIFFIVFFVLLFAFFIQSIAIHNRYCPMKKYCLFIFPALPLIIISVPIFMGLAFVIAIVLSFRGDCNICCLPFYANKYYFYLTWFPYKLYCRIKILIRRKFHKYLDDELDEEFVENSPFDENPNQQIDE